ncbi:MAG: hypothetical protein ABI663_06960 [Chryseolinea sp.]
MPKETYNYHTRVPHQGWLLKHIDVLLHEANKEQNTSFVLYSAFECRYLLEKTEFDILIMSSPESEWAKIISMAKGKNGINKTNNQYKALRYRFQTFSEALTKVVLDNPLRVFSYGESGEYQSKLSEYIHIYNRPDEDFMFESKFIQDGIALCNEVTSFVRDYYVKKDEEYLFGILNFHTLNAPLKQEFEKWKQDVTEDTEALYLRLVKINDETSGGAKAQKIDNIN